MGLAKIYPYTELEVSSFTRSKDTAQICLKGSSAGISFTHGSILGFFAPQGRHVAPIKVKFGREECPLLPAKLDLDRFGVGFYGPKN